MDKKAKPLIRVCIYARTSSEEKTASGKTSIEDQLEICREFASNNGMIVVFEEKDRDFSGRTYWPGCPLESLDDATRKYLDAHAVRPGKRTRPGLGEVIRRLEEINRVLVWDSKRLARPVQDSMLKQAIVQALSRKHVMVHSVKEGLIDRSDLSKVLTESVSELTSDKDINYRIEQSKTRLRNLRNDGMLFHCPTCYGFRSGGGQKVIPIPTELAVVRQIFDSYLNKTPILTICKKLNADGIPTKKNKIWTYSQVRAVLERLAYTGNQFSSDGSTIPSKALTPHANVSLAEWHNVQKTLGWKNDPSASDKERKRSSSADHKHPLSGLMFCGYCGYAMGTFRGTHYDDGSHTHYYRCRHSLGMTPKQAGDCRFSLIRETLKGNTFGCGIYESLLPLATLGAYRYFHQDGEMSEIKNERESLSREIKTLEEREIRLYEDEEQNIISPEQRHSALTRTLAQREIIKKRIEHLDAELTKRASKIPFPHEIISDIWTGKELPGNLIRQFLHEIIQSIHVFAYRVAIKLKTGDEFSLERIPVCNARLMPHPMVASSPKNPASNTTLQLIYQYKSHYASPATPLARKYNCLVKNTNLIVGTMGINPAPYARTRRNKKKSVNA